jgi:hypothetical protein
MSKDIILEKGSYYKVEKFGEETHRFVALEDDYKWVHFVPNKNKTNDRGFVLKTTKVYSTNGNYYDIIPHFWLAKDGRGYYKPVPNGGFHIVPTEDFLMVDGQGVEVSHRDDYGNKNFLFIVHKQGTRKWKECKDFDYPQTLTKIC